MGPWGNFAIWASLAVIAFAVGATAKATGHPSRRFIAGAAWALFALTLVVYAGREQINVGYALAVAVAAFAALFVWAASGGGGNRRAPDPRRPTGYSGSQVLSMDDPPRRPR